jgi:hypothetical protein
LKDLQRIHLNDGFKKDVQREQKQQIKDKAAVFKHSKREIELKERQLIQ